MNFWDDVTPSVGTNNVNPEENLYGVSGTNNDNPEKEGRMDLQLAWECGLALIEACDNRPLLC
eukprot:9675115-Prorocentrum_lima.AAC.1